MLTDAALEGKRDHLRRPEGERDHRQADPGGHRPQALPDGRDRSGRAPQRPDEQFDDDALAAELGLTDQLEQPKGADVEGFGASFADELEELASEIEVTGEGSGNGAAAEPAKADE